MAFPVVESTATSDEASDVTSHVVTMPASVATGDLLIIWIGAIKFTTVTFSWPGGADLWTELDDTYVAKTGAAVAYRIADGTEGSTITVTSSSSVKSGSVAFRISGAGNTPEIAVLGASSTSNAPDPPDLTPTWGSADTLWLASGVSSQGKHSATPANYTDLIKSPVWNSFGQTYVARRERAATSENPGAFTIDWANDLWVAQTLAVEPAATGATGTAGQTLEEFTQLAIGTAPHIGTAAQTLVSFSQVATGAEKFIGSSAQTLELLAQLAEGTHIAGATGTVEQTLELLVQIAAGIESFIGTSEQTLELLTQVSSGKVEAVGSAAQTLELLTQLAAGIELFAGTADQVLELLTQLSSGGHTQGATGSAAQTLESLTQVSTGIELFTGTVAQTLELITQLSSGSHIPIAGTAIQVLELLTQVVAGIMHPDGTVVQTLELLTQLGTGALQPSGVSAQTLEELSQLGVGAHTGAHTGTIEQTLELLIQVAVGLVLATWGEADAVTGSWSEEGAVTGGWTEEDAVTDGWTEEDSL